MFYPDERAPSFIFKQIVCAACIILCFGLSPSLIMFLHELFDRRIVQKKGQNFTLSSS